MFKKIIDINNENELQAFYHKLFFYKTYFFFFTKFYLPEDKEDIYNLSVILTGLNIKNRRKRINYIIDAACRELDAYYNPKNLCQFKKAKCLLQRQKKEPYCNGCCHRCRYQSKKGCLTKNVACKLFYCSKALQNEILLKAKDLKILSVLNCMEKYIIVNDYFSSVEEVSSDSYYGFIIAMFRVTYRHLKYFFQKKIKIKIHTSA